MAVAWLFPGQGSQQRGMGSDVLDRFGDRLREADEILGWSVRAQCLDGAAPGLDDTRYVQPALFVVEALGFLGLTEDGGRPDFVAGHSLGEYAALFAAGCFDFATGVRLVRRRGELMSGASGGGMLAVVRAPVADVVDALLRGGVDDVDVANHNAPDQVVLSGPDDALREAGRVIRAAGAGRCVPLRVSAPFHSRYMEAAADELARFLERVEFAEPRIPVVANVTARPYARGAIREGLAAQVRMGVRWAESLEWLCEQGVRDVVEVGPGRTLTGLWPRRPVAAPPAAAGSAVAPDTLGSAAFRREYGIKYAYVAGSMFRGIASTALVVRMARAGLMGFFGAGGLTLDEVEEAIRTIRAELPPQAPFGMNLLATPDDPALERAAVELYLRHDIRHVEAASYTQVTPELVRFRFTGAEDGRARRTIVAKVSRPEVARAFMSPPPPQMLERLAAAGALRLDEVAIARTLPVSADVCVEADSGGHTDAGSAYALMPAMTRLRDELTAVYDLAEPIRIGAAGGIGTPDAVAAAFVLGADFVVTGSVNQCTPEAGTSDLVKDMLADLDVQDTAYAPAGDMFELGARVQVVRKGTLFPARANKLYQLYRQLDGLDALDATTRRTLEERYFGLPLEDVWARARERTGRAAAQNGKAKMATVFRSYFAHSTRVALDGVATEKVNFQIHCGPALGALNRHVAGTALEPWRRRHVDALADLLMEGAAERLDRALRRWATA